MLKKSILILCLIVSLIVTFMSLPCASFSSSEAPRSSEESFATHTWAHAVNDGSLLRSTLANARIDFLEADIMYIDGQAVMAHPKKLLAYFSLPHTPDFDLTFA